MAHLQEHSQRAAVLKEKISKATAEIVATEKEMATWPIPRNITHGQITWDKVSKRIVFSGGTPLTECNFEAIHAMKEEMSAFREAVLTASEKEFDKAESSVKAAAEAKRKKEEKDAEPKSESEKKEENRHGKNRR